MISVPAQEDIEALVKEIEGTANLMLGMTLDPGIPQHAKEALSSKAIDLFEMAEKYVERFLI